MDVFKLFKFSLLFILIFKTTSTEYTLTVLDRVQLDKSSKNLYTNKEYKNEVIFVFKDSKAKFIDDIIAHDEVALNQLIDIAAIDSFCATLEDADMGYLFKIASCPSTDLQNVYLNDKNIQTSEPVLYKMTDSKNVDILPKLVGKLDKYFAEKCMDDGMKTLIELELMTPLFVEFTKKLQIHHQYIKDNIDTISRIELETRTQNLLNQENMRKALFSMISRSYDNDKTKIMKGELIKAFFRIVKVALLCVNKK